MQWPKRRRTLVTAVASTSNYVAGAIGCGVMPSIAPTGSALRRVMFVQVIVAAALFLAMAVWFWIPPVQPRSATLKPPRKKQTATTMTATATAATGMATGIVKNSLGGEREAMAPPALGLLAELKLCLVTGGGGWAGVQVLIFGVAIGVSLLLQGMNQVRGVYRTSSVTCWNS